MPKHFYYALRRISRGIIAKKILNVGKQYLSYSLDTPYIMGVSSLLQQATNLLIPVVSLGVSYAVIRFGLDKKVNKSSVFVNGGATISVGFLLLLLAMPLVRLIPNAAEYLGFLYLCVLASCMRTLCTQFIRSRMLNRLVAIDGVLTTLSLLLYYLLFNLGNLFLGHSLEMSKVKS